MCCGGAQSGAGGWVVLLLGGGCWLHCETELGVFDLHVVCAGPYFLCLEFGLGRTETT